MFYGVYINIIIININSNNISIFLLLWQNTITKANFFWKPFLYKFSGSELSLLHHRQENADFLNYKTLYYNVWHPMKM